MHNSVSIFIEISNHCIYIPTYMENTCISICIIKFRIDVLTNVDKVQSPFTMF